MRTSDLLPFPFINNEKPEKFDLSFQVAPNAKLDGSKLCSFLKLDECAKCPICSGSGKRLSITPVSFDEYGDAVENDPFEKIRIVSIGESLIDGNRLALALTGLVVPEMINVFIPPSESDNSKAKPFNFYGNGWRLVIMGQNPEKAKGEQFEVFEVVK